VAELGTIDLPVHQLAGGGEMEKWHTLMVNQASQGKGLISTRDHPAIRIKASLQSVSVLPHKAYSEFQEYLSKEYSHLVSVLEPAVSARWKDEIAQTLLRTLQVTGQAKEFLVDVVMSEVSHTDNENLVFRGNTFATKAVDTYMKMVGEKYLRTTLGDIINRIMESDADFEVDPMKLTASGNLQNNQKTLQELVTVTWEAITTSHITLPSDLRRTFCLIRQKFGRNKEDVCFRLISGSIFLRFFCPAILSPSLFHLCQEYPDERTNRKLTLVAKVIQSLANFTRFGVKEEYMYFMNSFVEIQIPQMKQFLQRISSPMSPGDKEVTWGPCQIDLGRELSIMHTILTDQLKKLGQSVSSRLPKLSQVLDNVRKTAEESGRNLIDDALASLREMDTQRFGDGLSPSPSDTDLPSSLTPGDYPSMLGQLGDLGTDGRKIAIKRYDSSSSVSTSGATTPIKLSAARPFGSVTTPVKERPHLYRASVPNLTEPTAADQSRSPWKLQRSGKHSHSVSVDMGSSNFDPNSENDIDRLRQELLAERMRRKTFEKEVDVLKMELMRSEETKKQLDFDLQTLSRRKGEKVNSILGILKKTEMAYKAEKNLSGPEGAQLKKELEDLKDALKRKDDIIKEQQKRIASLIEANKTLSEGLEQLHRMNSDLSGSESEDESIPVRHTHSTEPPKNFAMNGQSNGSAFKHPREPTTPTTREFLKVMNRLDKGQFEFS
jgi:RAS protein activator-like 2